jgi:hypothetical protein
MRRFSLTLSVIPLQVERRVTELIELSTRYNFAHWLAVGTNLRALMRGVSGDTREGLAWIEDHQVTRYMHFKPFVLALKAEALSRESHPRSA